MDLVTDEALVFDDEPFCFPTVPPRNTNRQECWEAVSHRFDSVDILMDDDDVLVQEEESGTSGESIVFSVEDEENIRSETITRLEELVLSCIIQLYDSLSCQDISQVKYGGSRISIELADRRKSRSDGHRGNRVITFPRNAQYASAKPLARLLRVVDLMHEALCNQTPTTKRDMFYKDVALFGSQSVVDKLVDDIAATMGLSRSDLWVRASAKGLFCGSALVIRLKSGEIIRGNDMEGALIPPSEDIAHFDIDDRLAWVLVVEKEAVFQTLCQSNLASCHSPSGPGVVITGKGYPDIATRQLVANLARSLPESIPILAVVDADPYGIDILSVYKYGSDSLAHESQLAARRLRWAGIMASELSSLGIKKEDLLPITQYDERKALSLLRRNAVPKKWRKELEHMLFTRRKAEIEVLCTATIHQDVPLDIAASAPPLIDYIALKLSNMAARHKSAPEPITSVYMTEI